MMNMQQVPAQPMSGGMVGESGAGGIISTAT